MKRKMFLITAFLGISFAVLLSVFAHTKNSVIEVVTVSVGVTFYHFAIRLAIGVIVNLIMKNKANHENVWFREKSFESKLYRLIGVRKWKKYLPTYSPDTFDSSQRTVKELIGATCQAEIVHELIMVFSLFPIILILFFDGAAVFITTSVLSMLIDSLFVVLQRYNRPRLVRVMNRFHKLKSGDGYNT